MPCDMKNVPGEPCCGGASCLCGAAWALEDWSFGVFGKTFSGGWSPAILEPETCARSGADCVYDAPLLVVDTIEDSGWIDLEMPVLSALCLCDSCGGYAGRKVQHWRRSAAYCSRVAVWHHVQTYASFSAISCGASGVKFFANVIYSATRIVQATDRISNRYKKWERDCDAGTQEEVGDFVYRCGDVDDYIIGSIVLPCRWPQLNTAGLCAQSTNLTIPDCAPAVEGLVLNDVIRLRCIDGACVSVTTAELFACAAGNLDGGCACSQPFQTCTFGVPIDAGTGSRAQRRQYSIDYESECYDCGSLPSTVELERTGSFPGIAGTGDVTLNVFDSATGAGCGTAPAVPITIPFLLSVAIS